MGKRKTTGRNARSTKDPGGRAQQIVERIAQGFAIVMNRVTVGFTPVHWLICWSLFLTLGTGSSLYALLTDLLIVTTTSDNVSGFHSRKQTRSPPAQAKSWELKKMEPLSKRDTGEVAHEYPDCLNQE